MPLFSWKPEYSVQQALLDSQHQQLFSILNSIYENTMNSLEVDSVIPKIDLLSECTKFHFATEEQYMRDKNVSDIDSHIMMHKNFTNRISMLRTHYHDNDLEVTKELIAMLGQWLLGHVLKEDMKTLQICNVGQSTNN